MNKLQSSRHAFRLFAFTVFAFSFASFSTELSCAATLQETSQAATSAPEKDAGQKDAGEKEDGEQTKTSAKVEAKLEVKEDKSVGVSFGNEVKHNWRIGAKVKGGSSSVKGMLVTLPVPTDWPEQQVKMIEENFPASLKKVSYRELDSGVRQIVANIGTVRAGQVVQLSATFEVTTKAILPPEDTSIFQIPKKVPRELKQYLGVSPQISYRNSKFRSEVKAITKEHETAWNQVEAIYNWIRENVQNVGNSPEDTLSVFRAKKGSAEDLACLMVAMCRCHKVPARIVWVDGTQYAEFYLEDSESKGHWFPVQPAGLAEFGKMSDPRIVLQKGDNIKVPEKKERQKFVREFATGSGKSKPAVGFARQLLPASK